MKIVGKNKTVYEYESSGRVKEPDGTAYPLKNRRGYMVKLLDSVYCTKQREQEISGALSSGNTWHGLRIMDMVYSHGKFAGVVYQEAPKPQPSPAPGGSGGTGGGSHMPSGGGPYTPPTPGPKIPSPSGYSGGGYDSRNRRNAPPARRGSDSVADMGIVKVVYGLVIAAVLGLLTYFLFFRLYIGIVLSMASQETAQYCYTFNFSGITGIIGGIVGLGIAVKASYENGGILYYITVPVGYLLGMVVVFFLVTIIVLAVRTVYAVFVALIPSLIIIGAIIYILKSVFSGGDRDRK